MTEDSTEDTQEDLLRRMEEEAGILTLVTGTLADGADHYAYAVIPPRKYIEFKAAQEKGDYNLAEFGEIVAHGPGKTPPEDVKKRMEDEYGANPDFEAELRETFENGGES